MAIVQSVKPKTMLLEETADIPKQRLGAIQRIELDFSGDQAYAIAAQELARPDKRQELRFSWPENIGADERRTYSLTEIKRWLEVFLFRFFAISQFKRSALPNGPKISSGGSLSPRGDWRAPSDGNARVWIDELHANVP
jgi:hypothetical protein